MKSKELRAEYKRYPPNNDLCSNQAERYPEEPTLQEKMNSFECKSVGFVVYSMSDFSFVKRYPKHVASL